MIPIDLDIKIEKILNFEVLKNGYLNKYEDGNFFL